MRCFKKACLKNCDKILNFVNFINGASIFSRHPACMSNVENVVNIFTVIGK